MKSPMTQKTPQTADEVITVLKSMRVMVYPNSHGQIESLHLWEDNTTDETLRMLEKLPGLKRLCLQGARITDKGLEDLSVLGELEELDLRSCKNITDKGIGHLSKMTNLRRVELYDTQIGDKGLESLCTLNNLKHLDIHSTHVTDVGLKLL